MDAFTPAQTIELATRIGAKKAHMRVDKLFFNSCLAGALLSFGCALSLIVETAPWFQTNAPGLIKVIGACFFPVGLVMITLTGADLITSNIMFMVNALIDRRCNILDLLQNWVVCYLGNLAGALFFMAILSGYAGTFEQPAYKNYAISFVTTKVVTPGWHQIFLRGIGCNWLVCMAVFLSISSREIISKAVVLWFPIMTFVSLGYDHVVANMYFVPLGIFLGHPQVTVGYYIWKSMIPSAIGNIVGGVLFISIPYWYLYMTGTNGVSIHFDNDPANATAFEVGGPLPKPVTGHGSSFDPDNELKPERTKSQQLPDSTSNAKSGLAEDLDAQKYGKMKRKDSDSTDTV